MQLIVHRCRKQVLEILAAEPSLTRLEIGDRLFALNRSRTGRSQLSDCLKKLENVGAIRCVARNPKRYQLAQVQADATSGGAA